MLPDHRAMIFSKIQSRFLMQHFRFPLFMKDFEDTHMTHTLIFLTNLFLSLSLHLSLSPFLSPLLSLSPLPSLIVQPLQTHACERNTRLLPCQMCLPGIAIGFIEETNISGMPFWGNEAWQQNIPVQHLIKMSWHASPNRFFCVSARVYHHGFHLNTARRGSSSWQGPKGELLTQLHDVYLWPWFHSHYP